MWEWVKNKLMVIIDWIDGHVGFPSGIGVVKFYDEENNLILDSSIDMYPADGFLPYNPMFPLGGEITYYTKDGTAIPLTFRERRQ